MSSTSTPESPAPALSIPQHFGGDSHPFPPLAVEPIPSFYSHYSPSSSAKLLALPASNPTSQHASALENGEKTEDCTCCNDKHRTRGRNLGQWLRKNKENIALVLLVLCVGMAFALVVHVHCQEEEDQEAGNVKVDESGGDEG